MMKIWRQGAMLVLILLMFSACDDNATLQMERTAKVNLVLIGRLLITHPITGQSIPLGGIGYQTGGTGTTTETGLFPYQGGNSVSFTLLNTVIGPFNAQATITENDMAMALCKNSATPASCQYATSKNLQRLLLSLDHDLQTDNGIAIPTVFPNRLPASLTSSMDAFELALGQYLNPFGRRAVAIFNPSVAINLEAVQPEADEVGGQPVPFADIFRVARPFAEYSCSDVVYDAQGWPVGIPASCANQVHPVLRVPSYATALLLRYVPQGAIPTGKYTVIYEGFGELSYSGIANKLHGESAQGRDVIEITSQLIASRGSAGLRLQIKNIDQANPVRNIRIVMPGGTCTGNPFIRVENESGCQLGSYNSFVSVLETDRNKIVFNPDYLRFLKDFKVVRTMNFMEASPRTPCNTLKDEAYQTCLTQEFTWDMRANLSSATWGGSARTGLLQRYARGAPLEVAVALANQLNRAPWFNIPHNATDDYITQYATYVRDNLNPKLKAHLEYSNEPWNGIFWSAMYVREKGKNLDSNPYRAGYKYYSRRAVQIFKIWQGIFGGSERLVRILNTYHPDEWMSRNMLGYEGNYQSVDVIASAPYFQGCWSRTTHATCADTTKIPKVTQEATSTNDLFDILDNPHNPYGIPATLNWMKVQAKVASDFGVKFYAYEGGQHLVVNWGDTTINTTRKDNLLNLMRAANRDPRMAGRYSQLLNGWKNAGGGLFALYTLPQTWHKFGSFGMKEHLNQPRFDAPKYDMSMQFQEVLGKCWWAGCE